jgi:Flp pilus assembly protein TadD
LLAALVIAALLFLLTTPMRRKMAEETARINQQTEQRIAAEAQQKQRDLQREQAKKAMEAAPNEIAPRIAYAFALEQAGQPRDAEMQMQVAVAIAPANPETYATFGEFYERQGRNDLAIEMYRKALRLDSHNVHALKNLAYRYVALGWNRQAEALLDQALKELPNEPRLHLARGLAAFQINDNRMAEREVREAYRLVPDDPTILPPLLAVLRHVHRYDEALQRIANALPMAPDKVTLLRERALVYDAMNRPEDTLAAADELLRLDPDNLDARYLRGTTLAKRGDIPGAIRELDWVYRRDPRYAQTALLLGQFLIRQGKDAEGRALIDESNRLRKEHETLTRVASVVLAKPDSPDAHRLLGAGYLAQGSTNRAVIELKRALELNPQDGETRRLLAQALRAEGRADEAGPFVSGTH